MVRVVKTGQKLLDHFAQFYTINKENGCWEWHRGMIHGYGQYTNNYKNYRAHRFSWILFKGALDPLIYVCHSCDNKKCVNPDHLWLGTARDNNLDAVSKKRNPHKETHGCSKLSNIARDEIVRLWREGNLSRKELADKYNVHYRTIQNIVNAQDVRNKFGRKYKFKQLRNSGK